MKHEHILTNRLKVGDYFKYRVTSPIEHYVQSIDSKRGRINEINSKLETSSIPFGIYVERIIR